MGHLHEILAAEKPRNSQVEILFGETAVKFSKYEFFAGALKTLQMVVENPANAAIEQAARTQIEVRTTVHETLEYVFKHWAAAEDLQAQKNITNQQAVGKIELSGLDLPPLPVDELLGLEVRLDKIRTLVKGMPTLNAAKGWEALPERKGLYKAKNVEVTTKTEKVMYPVVLAPATDKHPAQVKEATRDDVVGSWKLIEFSGAATTEQKAHMLERLDDLITAVKQARMRANETEVVSVHVGEKLVAYMMEGFK